MAARSVVYLVDDDPAVRESFRFLMKSVNQPVESFPSAEDFLLDFDPSRPGCLVLDMRMPGMSGLDLMDRLAERQCRIPVIFVTGHGDVPMAVRAMKAGALDILEKPVKDEQLRDCIEK